MHLDDAVSTPLWTTSVREAFRAGVFDDRARGRFSGEVGFGEFETLMSSLSGICSCDGVCSRVTRVSWPLLGQGYPVCTRWRADRGNDVDRTTDVPYGGLGVFVDLNVDVEEIGSASRALP